MDGVKDAFSSSFRSPRGRQALSLAASAGAGGLVAGGVMFLVCRRRFNDRLAYEIAVAKEYHHSRMVAAELRATKAEQSWAAHTCGSGLGPAATVQSGDEDDRPSTVGDTRGSPDGGEPKPETGAADPPEAELDEGWPGNPDESAAQDDNTVGPSQVIPRDRGKPYAIPFEEFGDEETCSPTHITYYAGDKTLCDEKDEPIPDILGTTGPLSIAGFGDISGDPNIRYVRNERLGLDFEIVLDSRAYVDVVLNYGRPS